MVSETNNTFLLVKGFLEKGNLPHLLFYGPQGCGKTSLAHTICTLIHKDIKNSNILELNASDDRGIDITRSRIKIFAESTFHDFFNKHRESPDTNPVNGAKSANIVVHDDLKKLKFVVLDECDYMTATAQTALRRILEVYSANVRFILICNNISKINIPVRSRCCNFRFRPISTSQIKHCISRVIEKKRLNVEEGAMDLLVELCNKDLRFLINSLQQCGLHAAGQVTKSDVCEYFNYVDSTLFPDIIRHICSLSLREATEYLSQLSDKMKFDIKNFIHVLHKHLLDQNLDDSIYKNILPKLAKIQSELYLMPNNKMILFTLAALINSNAEIRAKNT